MANPRQRRKGKSSTYKAVSHSKRAKRLKKKMPAIRGPKALQDAWDPSKTVRQNYVALGLQQDLNPVSSGGSEVKFCQPHTTASCSDDARSPVPEQHAATPALPKGFGRIIRDSSGNVVRVELPSDGEAARAPVVTSESELRTWVHDCPETRQGAGLGDTIVQDLENLAASATVRVRHTSLGERSYLERLVEKYGGNLDKMARDRQLNPAQRTTNELKRAIAKAGGLEALCERTDMRIAG